MRSIKSLAREAYRNRYTFDTVTVAADGRITGHWAARERNKYIQPVNLGHIDDCRAVRTPTGTRFYNRDFLVYTFGPGA